MSIISDRKLSQPTKDLVILIPGIRDHALWASVLREGLEKSGFEVELTNFGRFKLFHFLRFSNKARQKAQQELGNQIEQARLRFPNSKVHVIAHSFGTYLFTQLLKERPGPDWPPSPPTHRFTRVIFCGSVVQYSFSFEAHLDQFETPVLNEVGCKDIWPAVAAAVRPRLYGGAGTYGFKRPHVRDRWHKDAKHNYFLNQAFCNKFWVPFFNNGDIEAGDNKPENLPFVIDRLDTVNLWIYLILFGLIIVSIIVFGFVYL